MTRVILVALLAALLAVPVASVAAPGPGAPASVAAQQDGNWTLSELRQGGGTQATVQAEAPPSVRVLDDVAGAVAIRYKPAAPLQNAEFQYLGEGARIETNTIQVYSTVFGDGANYSLRLVSYQPATRQVQTEEGVTTERYPANLSTKRVDVEVGAYETSNVSLPGHYDATWQMVAILERNGEPAARWSFAHRSNPLMRSAPDTDSDGDLLAYGFTYFFLPAAGFAVIGRHRARKDLEDIVVGPMRGTLWWLGALFFGLFTLGILLFFQTATVLSAAPWVSGITIGVLFYLGYLSFRDHDLETAEFDQRDLEYRADPNGDERPAATGAGKILRRVYQDNNRVYLPKPGLLPMVARKWADPASIDRSEFNSVTDCWGDIDVEYSADPEAEEVLEVTPSHLAFDPPLLHPSPGALRNEFFERLERLEDVHWAVAALGYLPLAAFYKLRRVNWTFVAIAVVGFAIGYSLVQETLGLGGVAIAVGLVPGLIASTRARDGTAEFQPSPKHMSDARAILGVDTEEYVTSATFEALQKEAASDDLEVLEKAREFMGAYRTQLWENIDDQLGIGDNGESAAGGSDGGAAPDPVEADDD